MLRQRALWPIVCWAFALAGCFRPPAVDDCTVRCNSNLECPGSLVCDGPGSYCHGPDVAPACFWDDFESYTGDAWAIGSVQSARWRVVYTGSGTIHVVPDATDGANHELSEEPASGQSALVLTTDDFGDLDLAVKVRLAGTSVGREARILWRYQDATTNYVLKLAAGDHWELSRASTVIASGTDAILGDGLWHAIRIQLTAARIAISWQGGAGAWLSLLDMTDASPIVGEGAVGLADFDPITQFDDFAIRMAD